MASKRESAADLAADLAYLLKRVEKIENVQDAEQLGREVAEQEAAVAQAAAVENYEAWQQEKKQESDPWPVANAPTVQLFTPLETCVADVLAEYAAPDAAGRTGLELSPHTLEDLAGVIQSEAARRAGLPAAAVAEPLKQRAEIMARILELKEPKREDADVEDDDRPPAPIRDEMDEADNFTSNTDYMFGQAEAGHWASMPDIGGAKLPGAAPKYSTCGLWRFMGCPYDNWAKRLRHNCGRLSCHVCVRGAAGKIASRLARRLWLWRCMIQQETKGKTNPLPSHVIESIPGNSEFWTWSKQKQNRVLAECRQIAGLTGGVSISHLWRFSHDGKKTPRYSPHHHLLTYGWLSPTAYKDILAKFGIKVLYHKVKNGTLETQDDVFRVALYLLSHCEVKARSHAYRWYGELAYNKISNETLERYVDLEMAARDAEIEKSKSCKLCGAELKPARIVPECLDRTREYPNGQEQDKGVEWPKGFLEVIDLRTTRLTCYTETWDEEIVKTRREEIELREDAARKKKQELVAAVAGQARLS